MTTSDNQAHEPPSTADAAATVPGHAEPASQEPSRKELRDRALESRQRDTYLLGDLPSEEVGAEIDNALNQEAEEESTLGVAYQVLVLDDILDEERINSLKDRLENDSPGQAIALRQHLHARRFGIFPKGPSMASRIAARMKPFMNNHNFSTDTLGLLQSYREELLEIVSDTKLLDDEQEQAEAAEHSAGAGLSRPGVYVFTYPQYLLYPSHPSADSEKMPDRYLFKVGSTDKQSIQERVDQETSGTGIPEHRRILRAYWMAKDTALSYREFEVQFHDLLDAAGHQGPKRGSTESMKGGREWFYTSLEFLDTIAKSLNLNWVALDAPENEQ